MIRNLLMLSVLFLLVFGCLGEAPEEQKSQEENVTCEEYCRGQPHVECEGDWNISGEYPVCICQFVCRSSPESEVPNPAAKSCGEKGYEYELRDDVGYCSHEGKECEAWALFRGECCLTDNDCSDMECGTGAVSCEGSVCRCHEPEEDSEDQPPEVPTLTDMGPEELIDEMLSMVDSKFYSGVDGGDFTQKTYKWIIDNENEPGTIPIGNKGMGSDILFDDESAKGIIAFCAKTYIQQDGPREEAYAMAILNSDSPYLRELEGNDDHLDILYHPPTPDVRMEFCSFTNRDILSQIDNDGDVFYVYEFKCISVDSVGE